MEPNTIHIGNLINELLEKQRKSKRELGDKIGMSASQAVYLTTRKSIDVQMLWKVGVALKYNFFKHFPVEDGTGGEGNEGKEKISELEKQLESALRDLAMQKQENAYLKEINELLKKKE